jgi:hypothetical protein
MFKKTNFKANLLLLAAAFSAVLSFQTTLQAEDLDKDFDLESGVNKVFAQVFGEDLDTTKPSSLFGGELTHNGGYGAPEVKFNPGAENGAVFWLGGRGGWLINRSFSVGGAGYGLIPTESFPVDCFAHPTMKDGKLNAGYGGLYFEYINSSNSTVHFSGNLLIGFGGVSYYHPNFDWDDNDDDYGFLDGWESHPSSFIVVLEPGIAVDLNVASMFRISAGVGYRFIPNLDMSYKENGETKYLIEDNSLNGVSLNLTFKFGKF